MGKLRVLSGQGHTEVVWDVEKPETVSAAALAFADAVEQKFLVAEKNGDEITPVKTFNPEADEIVAVPQISGG